MMANAKGTTTLMLVKKNGTTISYSFTENPVITYQDNSILLSTDTETFEYPLSDILKITFSQDVNDNIGEIKYDTSNCSTKIYSVNGTLLKTIEKKQSINIKEFPKGIYIIKHGKTSYKITNKK